MRHTLSLRILASSLVCALAPYASAAPLSPNLCSAGIAQSEVRAHLLEAPSLFLNSAPSPTDGGTTWTAGVRHSLLNTQKAGRVREIAQTECEVVRYATDIEGAARALLPTLDAAAAQAKLPLLEKALASASQNLALEAQLLAKQLGTVSDLRTALAAQDQAQAAYAQAQKAIQTGHAYTVTSLPTAETLTRYRDAVARLQSLRAKLDASEGWDLSASAGVLTSASRSGAFVGVAASRSFGLTASRKAAQSVESLALASYDESPLSAARAWDQKQAELEGVVEAEQRLSAVAQTRKAFLLKAIEAAADVDSLTAQRLTRTLRLELLLVEAQLVESQLKQDAARVALEG